MQVQICAVLDLVDGLVLDYGYTVCNYLVCSIFCPDQQICLVEEFPAGLKDLHQVEWIICSFCHFFLCPHCHILAIMMPMPHPISWAQELDSQQYKIEWGK